MINSLVTRFVGLDAHKQTVVACILDALGRVVMRLQFDCTREALLAFAHRHLTAQDKVVVESTTNTWAVVSLLRPLVAEVVVSNPYRTKAIAWAKIKTDKVDAYVLAQLLRLDFLPRVWEPSAEVL
jgi:transposase